MLLFCLKGNVFYNDVTTRVRLGRIMVLIFTSNYLSVFNLLPSNVYTLSVALVGIQY